MHARVMGDDLAGRGDWGGDAVVVGQGDAGGVGRSAWLQRIGRESECGQDERFIAQHRWRLVVDGDWVSIGECSVASDVNIPVVKGDHWVSRTPMAYPCHRWCSQWWVSIGVYCYCRTERVDDWPWLRGTADSSDGFSVGGDGVHCWEFFSSRGASPPDPPFKT